MQLGDSLGVYFPLKSNAHALLAGRPIEAVRKRLKFASLLHDDVYLESGLLQIQAGAKGAIEFGTGSSDVDAEWQTPSERGALQGGEFVFSIRKEGEESTASSAATLRSSAAISWNPTFEPFRRELPSSADWIHFGRFNDAAVEVKRSALKWQTRDESNPTIERELPDSLGPRPAEWWSFVSTR